MLFTMRWSDGRRRLSCSSSSFAILAASVILLSCASPHAATGEPIAGAAPSPPSAASGSSSIGGGTWTIRAVPHQSSTAFAILYEQVQNLKYGWESNIDHLVRKIEMLESKIGRFDTSNQLRLEKLTESVNSKEIKDELAAEQMMRKADANYERLNHKIGLMESRLETTLTKMQTDAENSFNRLESRQADIETELTEINRSVEEVKKSTATRSDDKQNKTTTSMRDHLQTMITGSECRDRLEKLTGTIESIGIKLNDTSHPPADSQNTNENDASGPSGTDANAHANADSMMRTIRTHVDHESRRIENKISDMYNELWRRFMSLEMTVKTAMAQGNDTRRALHQDFRTLLQQRDTEPDSQENYMEIMMDAVMSRVQELTRSVDSNFQMVLTSQNLFAENCHRLQLDEPQLESKITLVLEKILNTVTNKTTRVDNRLVETMEMMKSHQSQAMRGTNHVTKMMVKMMEEADHGSKNFTSAIIELAEQITFVTMSVQELEEEIDMLTNVTYAKLNQEIEDRFDRSLEESNFDTESEDAANRTIENPPSAERAGCWTTATPFPSGSPTDTKNDDGGENTDRHKSIKYSESEEVMKIFSDDEKANLTDNRNTDRNSNRDGNNNNEGENGFTKISIVIPHRYYDNFENDTDRSNKNKIYKIFLQDLLNRTEHTLGLDRVGAIILNAESDRAGGNTDGKDDDKSTTKVTERPEGKNGRSGDESQKNVSKTVDRSNEDESYSHGTTGSRYDDGEILLDAEKKSILHGNTAHQNINERMKSKLEAYKNLRYKINNSGPNQINRSALQFLRNATQSDTLKRLTERYNVKRRYRLSNDKSVNISSVVLKGPNKSAASQRDAVNLPGNESATAGPIRRGDGERERERSENVKKKVPFAEKGGVRENVDEERLGDDSDEISNSYDTRYANADDGDDSDPSNVYRDHLKLRYPNQ